MSKLILWQGLMGLLLLLPILSSSIWLLDWLERIASKLVFELTVCFGTNIVFLCFQGCTVDWYKGKNVTVKTIKKKQKHKSRGSVRTVTRTVQNDSFFNFFNPPLCELLFNA